MSMGDAREPDTRPLLRGASDRKSARQARRDEKNLELQAKLAELRSQRDAKLAKKGEDPAILGKKVASEIFAHKSVSIYANGYVKIRGLLGGSPAKLHAISASVDVTKKSGLGRAAGAVATTGISLMGSTRRGDAYLIIVSDRGTHQLHTDAPYAHDIKAARTLEAAGQAVLSSIKHQAAFPPPSGSPVIPPEPQQREMPVADQIREMKALLDEGVISQEEFDKFKASILG